MFASLLALCVAVASPVSAASSAVVSHVTLESDQIYTNTGITLHVGDSVTIEATGQIRFGGGKIQAVSPKGIAWGKKCDAIASTEPRANPWPKNGVSCWSLIARVGTGNPFEVGPARSFRAARAGVLDLGLNDNFVDDNTGHWEATISVTAASAAPTPVAGATPAKKSSNGLVLVLVGVAVLALLAVLFWLWRRSKRGGGAESAPGMGVPVDPALSAASAPLLAESGAAPAAAVAVLSAPPETDSIDVNIFEVEFSNGLTLRVGYNHFPEGTELRWQVTQNRISAAAGSFVTQGGGSTNHVETIPLGVKLEGRQTMPDGADVQFDWAINGVPFRYSVRRDPNC
jgi:hypothetical protein